MMVVTDTEHIAPPLRSSRCAALTVNGAPCRAQAQRTSDACFLHDARSREKAAEARHLGGIHRRRKRTDVSLAFGPVRLDSVAELRRLLEFAAADLLENEPGVARSAQIIAVVRAATKLLEVGEYERRVTELEAVLLSRSNGGKPC